MHYNRILLITFSALFSLLISGLFKTSILAEDELSELHFTILHTNDEHAALIPAPLANYHTSRENSSVGGMSRLATAVTDIRSRLHSEGEDVLLVSAGDFISGSPYSWLILQDQSPELDLMLDLEYDIITLGNHEFDYNPEELAHYFSRLGYPERQSPIILGSNTVIPAGHALQETGIRKSYIRRLGNGLTIGFFGLMGNHAMDVAPGADPVTFEDPFEVAAGIVSDLEDEGVDLIIAINHSGLEEDQALAERVSGIDIIVGGHSHDALHEPIRQGNTWIVQAGQYLEYLGILKLSYDQKTGEVRLRNQDYPFLLALDSSVAEDPAMKRRTQVYTDQLNRFVSYITEGQVRSIDQVVMSTDFPLYRESAKEYGLGNFISDAMRFRATEMLGERVDFAFQANGMIRSDLIPGNMPWSENSINFYDLMSTTGLGDGEDGYPGYGMISAYITGEEVKRIMEISVFLSEYLGDTYYLQMSGMRMDYDPDRAIYFTIPGLNVPVPSTSAVLSAEYFAGEGVQRSSDFEPLESERLYHMVTDSYIASFLPMVGELLPSLEIVLKDRDGNPISREQALIQTGPEHSRREYKVWQAVAEYAMSSPGQARADGLSAADSVRVLPAIYRNPAGRLNIVDGPSLYTMPLIIIGLALLVGLIFLMRMVRAKQARRKT